jgi:spermidine/putrescine transport system substrate-binding protein
MLSAMLLLVLVSCSSAPSEPSLADELTIYNWSGDLPTSVLEIFTKEYDVNINYVVYESQEEAIGELRAGEVFDVVVMESRFIPLLVSEQLLAEIDGHNVPNFKNISANFRNLVYDPDNRYSIPYNWGTTGLIYRSDLVETPVTRWADLWDPRYTGKVGIWSGVPRDVIGFTLKSLGYSANSEDPAALEQALNRLLEIRPHVIFLEDFDLADSSEIMASGQAVISMAYAVDAILSRQENSNVVHVLPQEGALMWNDTFVIPSNSPNKATAELFLNFLLRPEISAQLINEHYFPMANELAEPLIDPKIRNDSVIYPANVDLQNAELILPLSTEGQRLYDDLWEQFLKGAK